MLWLRLFPQQEMGRGEEELLEEKSALRFEPEYYQDSSRMQELDNEIDEIHNQIAHATAKWEEAMEENNN